jgi:hypothetical protein
MNTRTQLAKAIIREIPVKQLRIIFSSLEDNADGVSPADSFDAGLFCGYGCHGPGLGLACGFLCSVDPQDPGLRTIDSTGQLGLTKRDLESVRADLPLLRQDVAKELRLLVDTMKPPT